MNASVVINTCALTVHTAHLSSGLVPYSERVWLLRNVLLPLYTAWCPMFEEVVVVGEWEPGPGYTYVPCPSVTHTCTDALLQRQMGYDALQRKAVPWVIFQHDDHLWDARNLIDAREASEVLSPARYVQREQQTALNDGWAKGHINGHVTVMRSALLARGRFRWTDIAPVFTWDKDVTAKLAAEDVRVRYAPELVTWDLERGAEPWR